MLDQLFSSVSDSSGSYLDEVMRANLGEFYEPLMLLHDITHQNAIQARIPFLPNIH